ncbi:MAG: ATP synthase F1 subunit epsilon [Spirochaetia bacterium]|jgi:F-type H+-transporting ATPase subunit epsilon|nr:ATP synthase F1 subunit epsilon [Spirochaetia bacterium]
MPEAFTLEVHTPHRLFFSGKVRGAIVPLDDGEAGIVVNHSPFIAPLAVGILKIQDADGLWTEAFITSGILEVKTRKTVILVEAAEWPGEINEAAARASKNEAEETLKTRILKFETATAREKLKRAEMRLKVAGRGRPGTTEIAE